LSDPGNVTAEVILEECCLTNSFPVLRRTFFLGGPTSVGKSDFALELASRVNGEIVGADAFQIYAGLSLLTAQPRRVESIPHHMIACVGVQETYNAVRYHRDAFQQLEKILQRGKTPIVVGGTGLYFRALIQGFDPAPPSDPSLRRELEQLPLTALQARLARTDPTAITRIDMRNPRRVLRAIEICELSGRPLEDFHSQQRKPISAERGWVLLRDREDLYRRISVNVSRMWAEGVVYEVKAVQHRAGQTAARAIGFREILAFLDGKLSEIQCREASCLATRRYAKRQLTWFRNQTKFKALNLSVFKSTPLAVDALFLGCSSLEELN